MVSAGAVAYSLELVGHAVAWCNRAFDHAADTVSGVRVLLLHAVPMNRGAVIGELVDDCDFEVVAQLPSIAGPGDWPLTRKPAFASP